VIVVATVDPAVGAGELPRWANSAVVFVTAGKASAQRINGTAELLRAASVGVRSAVLLNADPNDDSIGLINAEQSTAPQPMSAARRPEPSEPR
jgi:hypothetical protein